MTTHPGLADLFGCSLMSALSERRTRRVARGTSIVGPGSLSYTSSNKPEPLSELEEAVIIVLSAGLTAPVMHDGPLKKPDGTNELGSPFLNLLGRSAGSADNSHATSFFLINDTGIWLLKPPRGDAAQAYLASLPANWADWSEADWIRAANSLKVQVSDRRLEFPREFPYYLGWNKQISNVPGTTVLFPVVDCTRQYINALMILLSEPDGQRPVFVDDWQQFEPADLAEAAVWLGAQFGFPQKIPYQPIGGIKWVQNGFCNANISAPLGLQNALRIDHEAFLLLQNLTLTAQALGLGGWIHSSVFAPYILQRDPAKGWYGLGFRMETPDKTFLRWPPVPASQPNPVGIDGILEGLCPPYIANMDTAVNTLLDEKYGPKGTYGNPTTFAQSYKDAAAADEYLKNETPFSPLAIEYAKEICNYLWDKYGRFPAHVDAFHVPGIWLQFSHVELEYYEKYFDPALYQRQAAHATVWAETPKG